MLYLLLLPHYLPLYLSTSLPLSFSPHLSVSSIILCLTFPLSLILSNITIFPSIFLYAYVCPIYLCSVSIHDKRLVYQCAVLIHV